MRARRRRGVVLLLVLVAISAVALCLLPAVTTVWRADRAMRASLLGRQLHFEAELALAKLAGAGGAPAPPDGLATREPSAVTATTTVSAEGVTVQARVVRTHPQVLWLAADARHPSDPGALAGLRRALWLAPPAWPVRGALMTATSVPVDPAWASSDEATDRSGCTGVPHGGVPPVVTDSMLRPALAASAPGWPQRFPSWRASPPPAAGTWRAATIPDADSLVTGPVAWTGLLVRDGPLRVRGTVQLQGVLAVHGSLDVTEGRLTVRGALLVSGAVRAPTGALDVRWDRCAVTWGLGTAATLRSAPFFVWLPVMP